MLKITLSSAIVLLLLLIEVALSQGLQGFPRNAQDVKFYDMEKIGNSPKDVNFRFGPADVPSITVDIVKIKDQESSNAYITNKSKINIKWNDPNSNINNTYTLKLLYNVTQDYTTTYFYSYKDIIIQENVLANEFEYRIPKLEENFVYNIAVISDSVDNLQKKHIGISKTYMYKHIEKDNSNQTIEENPKSGISPIVYVIIGIVGLVIIGLAFLLSKSFGNKDRSEEEEDIYNFSYRRDSDHVSVVTDDTGEVSWSNLEIAQTSQQTKNEANDKVIRTLERGFKRDDKDRSKNVYLSNENQIYKVVRMFTPSEEDEIKLNIGDEVEITVIFEDGWCEGVNKSTNEGGVFPRTCLVEFEQYASMIEKSKNSLLPSRRRSKRNSYTNSSCQFIKSSDILNIPNDIQE
ncbi:hypothetical protein BCR36DRAFT_367295 [Piromyces finnis]|uniref:SH3 domain-containing protein n=1 Tax=Piromyces finnis TaxID=1754191 RepID=A0A1Y1VJ77_9FUNG|nr:hypothetical protein BCR36DRAFT_367295 [Piromyces finnis]|eukprot:ORX57229.1 hypothetical protein BCR36DRAFT_367295 [Piromyces finnis]